MPTVLEDLVITEVSLCEVPANSGSRVTIWKSARDAEIAKGEALMAKLAGMKPTEVQELFKSEPETYWAYRQASRRAKVAARSEQVSVAKGPVYDRVMAAAQELIRQDPSLTLAQALGRIFASHPGTYSAYRLEVATGASKPLLWPDGDEAA